MILLLNREDLNAFERERDVNSVSCSDFTDAGITPQLVNRADVIVFHEARMMSVIKNRYGPTYIQLARYLGQFINQCRACEAGEMQSEIRQHSQA